MAITIDCKRKQPACPRRKRLPLARELPRLCALPRLFVTTSKRGVHRKPLRSRRCCFGRCFEGASGAACNDPKPDMSISARDFFETHVYRFAFVTRGDELNTSMSSARSLRKRPAMEIESSKFWFSRLDSKTWALRRVQRLSRDCWSCPEGSAVSKSGASVGERKSALGRSGAQRFHRGIPAPREHGCR
jgi:hypothetical protein